MIKAIATLSICCVLGGGILLGTVEDEQTTADMPRIPQIVDLSNEQPPKENNSQKTVRCTDEAIKGTHKAVKVQ